MGLYIIVYTQPKHIIIPHCQMKCNGQYSNTKYRCTTVHYKTEEGGSWEHWPLKRD